MKERAESLARGAIGVLGELQMAGNRVFAHALILCIASALLLAPWGTLRVDVPRPAAGPVLQPIWIQADQQLSSHEHSGGQDNQQATGGEELVFGWQGAIALGQVRVAYWAICLCLMTGALASAFNFLGWTRLPSLFMFACFGFTAACALVAAIQHALLGNVGTGSVLAIACALTGLLLSPADEVNEKAEVEPVVERRRQFRSAA